MTSNPVKYIVTLAVFVLGLVVPADTSAQKQMWVSGYWPVWANPMTPETANWTGLTHVIHFSANPVQTAPYLDVLVSPTDSMKMENNGADVGQVNRLIANAHAHGVKVLLSLGGIYGPGATNMNFICADSGRTDVFATASVAYAKRRGYDGIEVDWEPPSSAAASARLFRLIRRELNNWPVRGQLAVAVANNDSFSPFTRFYDTQELINDVDQCNVMMYDMHLTPSYSGSAYDVTAFNAPLNPPGPAYPTIDQYSWNYEPGKGHAQAAGVHLWNAEGMPLNRIAAGIPFYGYFYRGKSAPNQPRSGVWPQYISYANAMQSLNQGGIYHWDNNARVPWISGTLTSPLPGFGTTGDQFYITFEDSTSITEKIKWAKQTGLGGIMIYELYMGWVNSAIVKDPLLRAVNTAMGAVTGPPDSIPPSVRVAAPPGGTAILTGTPVTIIAEAGDNIAVARVDILIDATVAVTLTTPPYRYSWNTTDVLGTKSITARAYDAANNSTLSQAVSVTIKPLPPKKRARVSGQLFFDRNLNGTYETTTEIPLAGWVVTAQDSTGTARTLTDGNGYYLFDTLATGPCTVSATQESSWLPTFPVPPIYTFSIATDSTVLDSLNFGFFTPFSVLSYLRGWNMVSLPVQFTDRSVKSVFPQAISAIYNNLSIRVDTLAYGPGYWLKFPYDLTFALAGSTFFQTSLPVTKGWNIAGSVSKAIAASSFQDTNGWMGMSTIWGFDGRYVVADSLYPGKGYWIRFDTSGTAYLSTLGGADISPSPATPTAPAGVLTLGIANGYSQDLYLLSSFPGSFAAGRYALPPVPPDGVFDVRFSDLQGQGSLAAVLTDIPAPVEIRSADGPISLSWNIPENHSYRLTVEAGRTITMEHSGTAQIPAATAETPNLRRWAVTNLSGNVGPVPSVFGLEGNYPNPFNAGTTIVLLLPFAGRVTASIFNILGEKVGSLFNGTMSAGHHRVPFDASSLPTGIYYCRASFLGLNGDAQAATIKMILAR